MDEEPKNLKSLSLDKNKGYPCTLNCYRSPKYKEILAEKHGGYNEYNELWVRITNHKYEGLIEYLKKGVIIRAEDCEVAFDFPMKNKENKVLRPAFDLFILHDIAALWNDPWKKKACDYLASSDGEYSILDTVTKCLKIDSAYAEIILGKLKNKKNEISDESILSLGLPQSQHVISYMWGNVTTRQAIEKECQLEIEMRAKFLDYFLVEPK